MNRRILNALLVPAILLFSASSPAHHSSAMLDTTAVLWVKGTVVRFERINPHSVVFMDERREDGQVRRWAVDGPSTPQLERMGVDQRFLKAGDVIEFCGFATKDGAASQRTFPKVDSANPAPAAPTITGQVMNGTVLVMPDGKKWVWSDYGLLQKCVTPGGAGFPEPLTAIVSR